MNKSKIRSEQEVSKLFTLSVVRCKHPLDNKVNCSNVDKNKQQSTPCHNADTSSENLKKELCKRCDRYGYCIREHKIYWEKELPKCFVMSLDFTVIR